MIAEKNRVASEIAIPGSTAAVQAYLENANNNNNDDGDEAMDGGKFELSLEADPSPLVRGVDPALTQSSPNLSAVLIEASVFDEQQTSVLVVHVPAAVAGAEVGPPSSATAMGKLPTVATICVVHRNPDDAIQAILPELMPCQQQRFKEKLDLSRQYGKHMTYPVLNAAYQAMAPQMEGWTVRVVVYPPFHFGDVHHVTMIKATGDHDSLMIFPLEREMPEPFEKKP
ncbi:MAG: hypothetical protein ACAH17_00975 [Candidatus Paceibacterota bacterium]